MHLNNVLVRSINILLYIKFNLMEGGDILDLFYFFKLTRSYGLILLPFSLKRGTFKREQQS